MKHYAYEDLLHIIETLRGERGCPWDKEQTHESLVPCLLEETYELVDAIKKQDIPNLKEELGDVLLQVLMHAQIAKEDNEFVLDDVVHDLAAKLVYRHPHVFGTQTAIKDTDEVLVQWDELKTKEKNQQTQTESMLQVAKALPALIRSQKVQKKAAKVGFMWETHEPIIDKIIEELEEVKKEIEKGDKERLNQEIGDLLFSVVNLSSFFGINPEFALTNTTEKFINRFRYIENSAFVEGKELSQMTLEEMDHLWQQAKEIEPNI